MASERILTEPLMRPTTTLSRMRVIFEQTDTRAARDFLFMSMSVEREVKRGIKAHRVPEGDWTKFVLDHAAQGKFFKKFK
jgi:hypothetical protein